MGLFSNKSGWGIGLKPSIGTRLILSTPQLMNAFPAPIEIAPAAMWTDCIDEPHHLLTVIPAVLTFIPDIKVTTFPILKPCSPSGKAQPAMISSISSGLILDLVTKSLITWDKRSSGLTVISSPLFAIVKGDLAYPATTALGIFSLSILFLIFFLH